MPAWGGMAAQHAKAIDADNDARLLMEHEASAEEWAAYEAHRAARREELRVTAAVDDWTISFDDVPF